MKALINLGIAVSTAILLSGCFGGSSSDSRSGSGSGVAASTDFTTFVKKEIANTRDDREAVNINSVKFSFNDRNNAQAYSDLFSQ
ncbi:hypothetical protein MSNKSG1_15791 [Marinobacter santoriniensis NKSG1]|uniref:Lipoprotein n=1 Tax=Marinobacter santoriniensis NKSG1 TaxID=1288826 RepID=M7CMP9_9GAMM|nr:hypothetical protein [Marinobacter santoriniensis]EMP54434.1 hypothetical protein MSNKSG1_15791 [Marinobacter santoriniensis NKSG1]